MYKLSKHSFLCPQICDALIGHFGMVFENRWVYEKAINIYAPAAAAICSHHSPGK